MWPVAIPEIHNIFVWYRYFESLHFQLLKFVKIYIIIPYIERISTAHVIYYLEILARSLKGLDRLTMCPTEVQEFVFQGQGIVQEVKKYLVKRERNIMKILGNFILGIVENMSYQNFHA